MQALSLHPDEALSADLGWVPLPSLVLPQLRSLFSQVAQTELLRVRLMELGATPSSECSHPLHFRWDVQFYWYNRLNLASIKIKGNFALSGNRTGPNVNHNRILTKGALDLVGHWAFQGKVMLDNTVSLKLRKPHYSQLYATKLNSKSSCGQLLARGNQQLTKWIVWLFASFFHAHLLHPPPHQHPSL